MTIAAQPVRVRATRLVVASLVAWLTMAGAAGFLPLGLDQRLAAAYDAVAGVVSTVEVEVRDGEPWTRVVLEVERQWLREGERVASEGDGGMPATIAALFWGGRAPGVEALQVAGVPSFAVGERVLWLLRRSDQGLAAPTVGVTQGVWRASGGGWIGDDGSRLGVNDDGDLALDAQGASDDALFAAIEAAFDRVGSAP